MARPEKVVIGNAELWLGDCREILPELGRFDLLLTDPPYGIGISSNPVRQAHQKMNWDNQPPSDDLLAELISKTASQIIWGGNYFGLPPSQGFYIWDKFQPENFSLAMCEMAWTSIKKPAKIFRHSVTSYQKCHPTQKPVALMEWCLQQAGNPRSVLDPFAGSFSTGVACVNRGIPFVGIEREPRYFEAGLKRIEQAQAQGKLFLPESPKMIVQEALAL